MPIYIDLANMIVDKKIVDKKYDGGCVQFRIDWDIDTGEYNQEDDELFGVARMNADEFDIEKLIQGGLEYDEDTENSNDFVIITRYGGALWQTGWLNNNGVFAWHSNCIQEQKDRAIYVGEIMTMQEVVDLGEKGVNVFQTIKKGTNTN
ncbi:MAG: hypothetical protein KC517_07415 [Bacteroidetes bacterium]|nr:hypothetical protein [Bacteroidota bacterium]